MPEGNEIHRFAQRHAAALAGKRVSVDSPNGAVPDAEILHGRRLHSVEAYGKHLGYVFGPEMILHIHLGMFGDWWEGKMPLPPEKGARWLRIWSRTDWIELHGATDCRIFDAQQWQKLLDRLGPDPLRDDADPETGFAVIARRNAPIGQLLMDQSVFAGIGNIYRAELLFRAAIHPRTPGSEVPRKAVEGIWRDARRLMPQGIEDRRIVTTMAKDRPHKRGPVQDDEVHYVYRRHGKRASGAVQRLRRQTWRGAACTGALSVRSDR